MPVFRSDEVEIGRSGKHGDGPLISVVVCAYNAGPYLAAALRSIRAQTYSKIEVLLIDDGSTDGSVEAVSDQLCDPRIRLIRQPNAGKPSALNVAIREMSGEYYVLNDADDVSHPTRIERQLEAMRRYPDVAAVYCGHELIIDGCHLAPRLGAKDIDRCRRDVLQMIMPAHDPTGMYRMSLVRGIRYDESLPVVEGYDYVLRVGEKWPMVVIGECLYSYRIHRESVTRRDPSRRNRLVREAQERACRRRGLDPHEVLGRNGVTETREDDDNNLPAHFMDSVCDLRREGNQREAVRVAIRCGMLRPMTPHYWKALLYAVAPCSAVGWIRGRRAGSHALVASRG